jgi:hypothetical protein
MGECAACNKTFSTIRGLSIHMFKMHRFDGDMGEDGDIEDRAVDAVDDDDLPSEEDNIGWGDIEDFNRDLEGQREGEPSAYYLNKQYDFCKDIYGDGAIYKDDWESFVSEVNSNSKYKDKDLVIIRIYQCLKNDLSLSRSQTDKVLKLFHNLIDVVHECVAKSDAHRMMTSSAADLRTAMHSIIPNGWRQVANRFGNCKYPKGYSMPYPDRWFMDRWKSSNGRVPGDISLIPLDPILQIAQQWLDPEIAFGNINEIKFSYTPDFDAGKDYSKYSCCYLI